MPRNKSIIVDRVQVAQPVEEDLEAQLEKARDLVESQERAMRDLDKKYETDRRALNKEMVASNKLLARLEVEFKKKKTVKSAA